MASPASPSRDVAKRRLRRGGPLGPGAPGELEKDLLTRLEVAQQGRFVDPDRGGDVGQGDLAHAVARRQPGGRVEDRLAALGLVLGAAGALEGGGRWSRAPA